MSATAMPSPGQTLVLYDGVCELCNRLVRFLLRHDRRDRFRFSPLQSELGNRLVRKHGLNPRDFDSVVVIGEFEKPAEFALTRSDAALYCVRRLGGIWRVFSIGRIIPAFARDAIYNLIARHRYRVFGKYEQCPLPKPEDRHKFVG